jgi:hypothetical protein
MYSLLNKCAEKVVSAIQTIDPKHVLKYDWLRQHVDQVTTPEFQKNYRFYWAMNPARLSPEFYAAYFDALNAAMSNPPTLSSVVQTLYAVSARQDGERSLQFSFATKLLHFPNPHSPIYDSQVAAFYFFQEPTTNDLQKRIDGLVAFHNFLGEEYARILKNGLLAHAIEEFRTQLKPLHFTDEKIVDSLIWAFVSFLRKGALPERRTIYS